MGEAAGERCRFTSSYRISEPQTFHLHDIDPGDTHDAAQTKKQARALLERSKEQLATLQEKLYAQDSWALLVVLQGIDAAGKDGVIKHVMSGLNPQGVDVRSFKAPSPAELDHDYLWRAAVAAPERGRITIFNRSYYEEVLVVRVHPELLAQEKLPPAVRTGDIWSQRYEDINAYERFLTRNGIAVAKFCLHLSKEEQARRFLKRVEDKKRHWKFSAADLRERRFWDEYQAAFEEMIRATSTVYAPWYVVPADHKWFARYLVSSAIVELLDSLKLRYPQLSAAQEAEIAQAASELRAGEG